MKNFLINRLIASITFAFIILILTSCNSASVRFYNHASDPFELFIDGKSQGVVPANTFVNITVKAGSHKFKVVQTEGYDYFATEYSKDATVKAGEDFMWSWGNLLLPSN